jgi:hypothetical protein
MSDGPDTQVLAWIAHLDLAGPAFLAAVFKYPKRNIALRQGARIIKRHDGEPAPPRLVERDPNLKSWSAHLIGGKKMQLLGYLEAVNEAAAIEQAVVLFSLDDERRKRLASTWGAASDEDDAGQASAGQRRHFHGVTGVPAHSRPDRPNATTDPWDRSQAEHRLRPPASPSPR